MDILTGKNLLSILLTWKSFIGQFGHPVGWEGMRVKGKMKRVVI